MKVLMLGWEYPPYISGGLGTACEGLTKALARFNTSIEFVVPKLFGVEDAPHMELIDVSDPGKMVGSRFDAESGDKETILGRIRKLQVPAFLSPYMTPAQYIEKRDALISKIKNKEDLEKFLLESGISGQTVLTGEERYGWDIFEEVNRFAERTALYLSRFDFDVIHAHDWMTYPAGVALSRLTGRPLVVHVHSLEYDRSGRNVSPRINEIEQMGTREAQGVIAVSYYTASVVAREHGIPSEKISVVHNGVYAREVVNQYRQDSGKWPSNVVLFLGRITFQKGPDYFVEAAARVIPHVPDVLFVMAGSGDMLERMQKRVDELGITDHFKFPGFLRGEEFEEVFSIANLYVMPSVSEPFGISALEAISFDTPVIISRQSGVSEVLDHALKVDFWDVDRMSDLMINALLHEELREDMVSMAREEIKKLRWDAAALKTIEVYRKVVMGG